MRSRAQNYKRSLSESRSLDRVGVTFDDSPLAAKRGGLALSLLNIGL